MPVEILATSGERKASSLAKSGPSSQLARRWAPLLIALSFLAIVHLTLFPFNFAVPPGMSLAQAAQPFDWRPMDPYNLQDFCQNILLFAPFGFALGCQLRARAIRKHWLLPIAFAVCVLFSGSIEFLQQWLPSRDSALADIIANATGGLIGAIVVLLAGMRLLRLADRALITARRLLVLPVVAVLLLAMCGLVLRSTFRLRQFRHNLNAWSSDFPLTLGNSPDGHRPWNGTVERVEIAAKAMPPNRVAEAFASADMRDQLGDAVLASYRIHGPGMYADLSGHGPPLVWCQSQQAPPAEPTLKLSDQHWLSSKGPLTVVNSDIAASNRFTVRLTFTPAGVWQKDIGRLFALSADTKRCNLIVGQEGDNLLIRLRTYLTGDNGSNPANFIPGFFEHPRRHDLIIVYDNPSLRVYVDSAKSAEAVDVPSDFSALHHVLARAMTLPFYGFGRDIYRLAFLTYAFAPFGGLLAFTLIDSRLSPAVRWAAVGIGLLLPPLAMQVILICVCGRRFTPDNLLLGAAIPAAVMLLWARWMQNYFRVGADTWRYVHIPARNGR